MADFRRSLPRTKGRLRTVVFACATALLVFTTAARGEDGPQMRPPRVRGFGLPLHPPEREHDTTFRELAEVGTRHVALFVHYYQADGRATVPRRHPVRTVSDAWLIRSIREARARGLEVAIVPSVLLETTKRGEWRGNIQPPSWPAWFAVYRHHVTHLADLAQREGASIFVVGSELASSERQGGEWRAVIAAVRSVFQGHVTYAANWDHYQHVRVWDALDSIALSAYYELARSFTPGRDELVAAWRSARERLLAWRVERALELPFLFVEVGYPSIDGCAWYPWDYTRSTAPIDLAEQRLCFEAFVEVWRDVPELEGVFFYEWTGEGGPSDRGYTPRGKPALEVVRSFFADE